MLFKLSIKNIKKSIKDYSIYFFTLVVAVAIFYLFNSLDAQESMLIMSDSKHNIVQVLVEVLNYISVFISVVLGFLIIYSNNFLIKRRKKEFGLYLTLGMSKRKVSFILVLETLLVGIFSLIIGLLIGVFLSQFLSILTVKLFEANMESFKFVFSSSALTKTVIYFGAIFVFVMIFNVFSLSRKKLIDLLNASKKNEKIKTRNSFITVTSFVLSLSLLWYAYNLLFHGALFRLDSDVIYMIIAGALGTFLLFFSVSGFFLKVIEKIKKIYYKDLNMFVLKQVNNKVNTTVLSTTIICLMLLLTIGILSGSMSFISVFNNDIDSNNMTDFTIQTYREVCENDSYGRDCNTIENLSDVRKIINKDYFDDYVKDYVYYESYQDETINMNNMIDSETLIDLKKQYGELLEVSAPLDIMSTSDYNKILSLYGEKEVKLKSNEYLLTASFDTAIEYYEKLYESGNKITINNVSLKPASKEIIKIGFQNYSAASNFGTIIVPDNIIKSLTINKRTIIGNYISSKNLEKLEKDFFYKVGFDLTAYSYITKLDMRETSVNLKAILIFVGLYLGITFAISSATVLAIGQLSESSDNKERYKVLNQIGADNKMIKKALFSQISLAFILPLVVALFHAYFGLRELNGTIKMLGEVDLTGNIVLTTIFIIIVYGGYFLATYMCSKSIIKE